MRNDSNSMDNKRIMLEKFKKDIANTIFIQVLDLIKECHGTGMSMWFLYKQVKKLRDSYKQ